MRRPSGPAVSVRGKSPLKRQIDNNLADLFIDAYHLFSVIAEKSFKKHARHIPGYELPSRKTVSNILIPTLYNKKMLQK